MSTTAAQRHAPHATRLPACPPAAAARDGGEQQRADLTVVPSTRWTGARARACWRARVRCRRAQAAAGAGAAAARRQGRRRHPGEDSGSRRGRCRALRRPVAQHNDQLARRCFARTEANGSKMTATACRRPSRKAPRRRWPVCRQRTSSSRSTVSPTHFPPPHTLCERPATCLGHAVESEVADARCGGGGVNRVAQGTRARACRRWWRRLAAAWAAR